MSHKLYDFQRKLESIRKVVNKEKFSNCQIISTIVPQSTITMNSTNTKLQMGRQNIKQSMSMSSCRVKIIRYYFFIFFGIF